EEEHFGSAKNSGTGGHGAAIAALTGQRSTLGQSCTLSFRGFTISLFVGAEVSKPRAALPPTSLRRWPVVIKIEVRFLVCRLLGRGQLLIAQHPITRRLSVSATEMSE